MLTALRSDTALQHKEGVVELMLVLGQVKVILSIQSHKNVQIVISMF